MIKIETKQLQEGAILAQPVITPLGQPLAPAGSAVTRQLINRMKLYRVEYAEIEGEEPAPQEETPKPVKEAKTYAQENSCIPQPSRITNRLTRKNFWAVSQICSSPATPSLKCLI